jgi:thiol-disulfide isomerase/thioredoxin
MKSKLTISLAIFSLLLFSPAGRAAEQSDAKADLTALVSKVQTKLQAGKKTEQDLAPELKEFETLRAKHKGEKSDAAAQIVMMEAMLYLQVLDNTEKAAELVKELKRDFPDTEPGKRADDVLADLKKQEESAKIRRTLVEGAKFPGFEEKDVAGKPLSIANYKGKVVLIDFWATWCGPCRNELPNVLKTYEKHHGEGFEIIGISLDKEQQKLADFTKEKNMSWPQYFDGLGWANKLAAKYGVNSIPATYLLDGQGTIIGKNLRGPALEEAVAKALAKK